MNEDTSVARYVGRYQVLEELGRGAMGIVYRGFDPVIKRTVALKTIAFAAQDTESKALRDRLYREAAAAGTLAHPSIVTIYDIIDDGATTAVAMEFVEGETLADVLAARGALPVEDALAIFEQICAALDYAGSKGIVHRDIKPANILLTRDGRPKVMDFGIARIAMQGQTQTSTIMGSPSYMSPEQVRGLPLDARSDLFSAAVVFFEMVAGERPFGGDDVATTMYRIVNEPPRAMDRLSSTISPAVAAVLDWALSKSPADRYQTGGELVAAIRQALDSGTVANAPYSEPAVVQGPASPSAPADVPVTRSSPLIVYGLIGSAILLLVVVLAIVFGGGLGQTTGSPALMSGGLAPAEPAPGAPAASPDAAVPDATARLATESRPGSEPSTPRGSAAPGHEAVSPRPAAQTARVVDRIGGGSTTTATARARGGADPTAPALTVTPGPVVPPATSTAAAGVTTVMATKIRDASDAPVAKPAAPPVNSSAPPARQETTATVEMASAVFAVKGEDYAGVRILVDDRLLPGPYPAQVGKIAAGSHRVVYRWISGPAEGHEISGSIVVTAGGHFIIRAALDSDRVVVQQLR